MVARIPETLLSRVSEFVAIELGLHFPKERWPDLERALCAASRECGLNDACGYIQALLSAAFTQDQVDTLTSHLTVGETYLFRERQSLDILREHILPDFIEQRRKTTRQIRIWSAGCATGEEAYSIAILLSRLIPDLNDWTLTILATDINRHFLEKASEGIYGEWSFRLTPKSLKNTYFTATADGRWRVAETAKKMVTFAYLNLAEDTNPALANCTKPMDVIVCRNVLMYFTPEAMKKTVGQFHRLLRDGGWLIVSPTENSRTLFSEFASVDFRDTTLFRKINRPLERKQTFETAVEDDFVAPVQLRGPMREAQKRKDVPIVSMSVTASPTADQRAGIDYAQALELYERGCYTDAERLILAVLPCGQDDGELMLLLARLYADQGRLEEALHWCEKSILTGMLDVRGHYLRAMILQERGLMEEAVSSLRRALYLDPRFVLGHFALGNLMSRQGRHRESKKHFENTLRLLARHRDEDVLPESGGLNAGRLRQLLVLKRSRPQMPNRPAGSLGLIHDRSDSRQELVE